ncbi:MAG TPA: MFS transporter [Gaiellaceae bacterium]
MTGRRNFPLLLAAFLVSTTGDWLYRLALPLLVLKMTGSALSTATTYALEYAPYLFFSFFGGLAADRFDRRRLLVASDLASAAIVGGLVVLVVAGVQQVWMIYLVAFALAAVRPFYHPAFQSVVPELVPDEKLERANARLQTVESVLNFAGPVLGGGIIAALGTTQALFANAISFLLSASAIVFIRLAADARVVERGIRIWAQVREGIAYLREDRVMFWGSTLMAGTNVGLYLIEANLIFYLVRYRDLPISLVGVVFGAQGVGAVIGAVLAPSLGRRVHAGALIVLSMLGAGAATAFLIPAKSAPAIAIAWGAVGIFTMIIVVTWFTLRQRTVPRAVLGRVVAISRMMSFVAIPIASIAGGALLGATGDATALIGLSALVQVAIGVAAWFTALRDAGRVAAVRTHTAKAEA